MERSLQLLGPADAAGRRQFSVGEAVPYGPVRATRAMPTAMGNTSRA